MRKIYPLSFNKFAVLVLYGLISVAAVTLAQLQNVLLNCMPQPMASTQQRLTIGYIQFFTDQPSVIENDKIPWDSYNYINVIAYPKDPKGPLNSIFRPAEGTPTLDALSQIRNLTDAAKKVGSNTKFLLSIRNYDPSQWPVDGYSPDYDRIIKETEQTITEYGLNGVDIEYPGLRAIACGVDGWKGDDKPKRDTEFAKFIGMLKGKITAMGGNKILMITAGREAAKGLGLIDYLNIETHHFSLYENLRKLDDHPDPKINSYPNSPLTEFDNAYKKWYEAGIDGSKILVGMDFGNTFQIVTSPNIAKSPEVEFESFPLGQTFNVNNDLNDLILNRINHCPEDNPKLDSKLFLYSIPWKALSTSILDQSSCNGTKDNWAYKFDEQRGGKSSKTPWLYRQGQEENPANYQFISYEDPYSINQKLSYPKTIGGVSISDISYDDSDSSLIKYITGIKADGSSGTAGKSQTASPKTTATDPVNETPIPGQPANITTNGGKIAGAVFGSLIGLFVLGALGFIGYRYRKEQPKSFSTFIKSLPNRKGFSSSGNHGSEMASDTTNQRVINNQSAVIPIASGYVTAMFDFTGKEENDLSFKKGDKIEVLERGDGPNDWWVGRVNGAVGEFPGNYVKET